MDVSNLKKTNDKLPAVFNGVKIGENVGLVGGDVTSDQKAGVWGFARSSNNATENGLLIAAPAAHADLLSRFGFTKPNLNNILLYEGGNPEALKNRELFWFPATLLDSVLQKQDNPEIIQEFLNKVTEAPAKKAEPVVEAKNVVGAVAAGMAAEKVASVMSENKFLPQLKQDAIDAAYRVAAKKINTTVRDLIVGKFRNAGWDESRLGILAEILDTELGLSLQSYALGLMLERAPKLNENVRIQKLAREFRVEGTAGATDMVAGLVFDTLLPGLTGLFSSLPEREENTEVSVSDKITETPVAEEVVLENRQNRTA